jgi:hypothetical protein
MLPPLAARAAFNAMSQSSAGSTGVSRKPRTDRRAAIASETFMPATLARCARIGKRHRMATAPDAITRAGAAPFI